MNDLKKNSVSPEISVVEINATSIICRSGTTGGTIESGGVIIEE